MVGALVRALFLATVPIGVVSYMLTWWALKHDYFGAVSSLKDMEQKVKQHTKAAKQHKKAQKDNRKDLAKAKKTSADYSQALQALAPVEASKLNPVHKKWLAFGGGFYGVMALVTYVVVELLEIRDFFANFSSIFDFLSGISFNLLVGLLVNSIMNFVAAIAWPAYWLNNIRSDYPWVWIVAAYAGYWLGSRYALRQQAQIVSEAGK